MSLPIFSPSAYMMFQGILGTNRARRLCIEEYVKPLPGKRILDVGCGPAYVAGLMEGVIYVGLDTDARRIEYAKRMYGSRGTFYCQELDDSAVSRFKPFDITIMFGLLHHLDDKTLLELLKRVKRLLVPGGKVVTLDGCYRPGQSFITKKLLDEDQGRYVRTKEQYISLARQVFDSVDAHIHDNLAFIPYTYIMMELSCNKANPGRSLEMKRTLSKNAKTKVLFINPNIKKETQHPILNSVVFSSPPLGLSYVVACLREKHPDACIKVFDEIAMPLSDAEICREVSDRGQPVIVGISALTATYSRTIEIARRIKESNPDAVVVFGGVHATALPEEVLMTGYADIVVRNEGEVTMTEVYEALSEGKSITGIQGISYREGGHVVHNKSREITDLSTLPKFPYDLYEQNIRQYSDFGYLLTSRGCPYDCIFCSNRLVTGMRYRTFTIEYVMDQLETLIEKYKQRHILFGDDTIISDKKRFFSLMENIVKRDFHKKARFTAQLRGEDMTEDVLDCMKKANFNAISCGIE
ncbi:MAG: cobalamin-dependent protein, partial [Candidatus Omnitrophota bacterium]|nr:cobalamin-dependent protein [Candidatus Omnitrophota bacterium]